MFQDFLTLFSVNIKCLLCWTCFTKICWYTPILRKLAYHANDSIIVRFWVRTGCKCAINCRKIPSIKIPVFQLRKVSIMRLWFTYLIILIQYLLILITTCALFRVNVEKRTGLETVYTNLRWWVKERSL